MELVFSKVSDFEPGILFKLLSDAYSFDCRWKEQCEADWKSFDDFFFHNLQIADRYGFITTCNQCTIGFVSWDPRNMPNHVEIGHNCILSKYKGNGYGKLQLREAVNRILQKEVNKIIVTTNEQLVPARKMYESVGFRYHQRRKNESNTAFSGEYIDYIRIKD